MDMAGFFIRKELLFAGLAVAMLASCVSKPPPAPPVVASPSEQRCAAAKADDPFVGNWLSVRSEKGVSGQLYSLFTLKADGTMDYAEQLKRGKKPPQGLHETGCWSREGQTLVLRTTESNGAPVELSDPIYTNRYVVVSQTDKAASWRGDSGMLRLKRMSPNYRLPY
jgi:hypothetical protein